MITLTGQNLSLRRKGRAVLHDVNIDIIPGEMLGLLGPNGAGKSTVMRILAGLQDSDGQVLLGGRPLRTFSPQDRARRIAYLPQSSQSHWSMPVASVVALGRHPHRGPFAALDDQDRAAIGQAMADTDIIGLQDRLLNSLSGGERARVLLARALAVEAPVLLADEPVAHLDPRHQLTVLSLLRQRAEQGGAVAVVLHDLTQAARLCDRICLLDQGRVAAAGLPQQVLSDTRLAQVYGVTALRGQQGGEDFLLPWSVARQSMERQAAP